MGLPGYQQSIASPLNTFERARLVGADFDGTTHLTFESDPAAGIYGTDEVIKMALAETFDFDRDAVKRYEESGGHLNETPREIIHRLAPSSTIDGLQRLTDDFVKAKMRIFQAQIGRPLSDGTPWPRSVPGFLDCWQAISAVKKQGEVINTALISAGHVLFIRRVLDLAGLEQPDILVTSETTDGLNSSLPPSKIAKPNPLPLMLAMVQWLNMHGAWKTDDLGGSRVRERVTFVGDSLEKDGGLAQNYGVDFIHISPDNPGAGWEQLAKKLSLGQAALQGAVHES